MIVKGDGVDGTANNTRILLGKVAYLPFLINYEKTFTASYPQFTIGGNLHISNVG